MRAARRRRGALHHRLGSRLPSRLPAHPRRLLADLPAGTPGARHHRDGERPGRRRRRRRNSGTDVIVLRGSLDREILRSSVRRRRPTGRPPRLARRRTGYEPARARASSTRSRSPTRSGVARLPARAAAHAVAAYSGQTDPAERPRRRGATCSRNRVKALVATSALGMGFDKPDLGFVVHSRRAVVADRLLPAGRPRRPRASTAPR